MTYPDPFAGAPVDEAQQTPAAPEPERTDPWSSQTAAAKPEPTAAYAGDATLTLKGGAGFTAPWLVLHDTLENIDSILHGQRAAVLKRVLDRAQLVAADFQAQEVGAGTSGASQRPAARQPAPAGAAAPPAGAPASPGPGWVYRSGVTKSGRNAGKTWQAWMPPQGSSESPLFFD